MLAFRDDAAIYLRTGATDMRKSINGLSALVQNEMRLDPFGNCYFLFCGRSRRIIKLLYWDRTGFALWYKRLEKDRFPWPQAEEEARKITVSQVHWLLSGIDFFKAHRELHFSRV